MPRRAMRGVMLRARRARRRAEESYALSAWSLVGRFRGRPGRPRGPMIDGMARSGGATASRHERWRPRGGPPAGCRCGRRRGGIWSRVCRGRPGSGRSVRPPFGSHTHGVDAGARPIDGGRITEPIEQAGVQLLPDAGGLPVAQASPAGRAAPAAQFLRQQPPRASRPEDEDDASEGEALRDARTTTFRLRRVLGQQRFDGFPEGIGDKG
jgi:hypothetical protein